MVTTAGNRRFDDEHLTQSVIGAFFAVYNSLRPGLFEAVYRRSMIAELRHRGLTARTEVPFSVFYRNELVGEYRADLVVDGRLIVECKALERLTKTHEAQLINYLHVSGLKIGLLLNFGPAATIRRLTSSSPKKSIADIPEDPVDR